MGLLEQLRSEAEHTASAKTLARVELVNTTPALVGSWDATGYARCHSRDRCHPGLCVAEPPRPTDIAGKTRWWLRAILAAGYYKEHGVFPSLKDLDKLASRILGSTREASRYIIRLAAYTPRTVEMVEPCRDVPLLVGEGKLRGDMEACGDATRSLLKESCGDPGACSRYVLQYCLLTALRSRRVRLAVIGKKGVEIARLIPLPPGFYRFILQVERRPLDRQPCSLREHEQRLLGTALAMALFFTGIGRMTTRGYGKLAPLTWSNTDTPLEQAMKDTWDKLTGSRGNQNLAEIAADATRAAQRYLAALEHRCSVHGSCSGTPDYPVLHERFVDSAVVTLRADRWSLMEAVNKSTSLIHIATCVGLPLNGSLAVLGLPRNNIRVTVPAGDGQHKELNRLQSPLVFTPIVGSENLGRCTMDARDTEIMLYITLFKYSFLTKFTVFKKCLRTRRRMYVKRFKDIMGVTETREIEENYLSEKIFRYITDLLYNSIKRGMGECRGGP